MFTQTRRAKDQIFKDLFNKKVTMSKFDSRRKSALPTKSTKDFIKTNIYKAIGEKQSIERILQ